jgi:hypothetical protein
MILRFRVSAVLIISYQRLVRHIFLIDEFLSLSGSHNELAGQRNKRYSWSPSWGNTTHMEVHGSVWMAMLFIAIIEQIPLVASMTVVSGTGWEATGTENRYCIRLISKTYLGFRTVRAQFALYIPVCDLA